MKIIVISEGESLDSYVADDFGHAPYFLLVDSDTLDYHVIVNEYADSPEGAGFAVAKAIVGLGDVDAVITGGMDVSYDEEGTVEQCVTDYVRRVQRRKSFEAQADKQ